MVNPHFPVFEPLGIPKGCFMISSDFVTSIRPTATHVKRKKGEADREPPLPFHAGCSDAVYGWTLG
jgi:hypothetical protein